VNQQEPVHPPIPFGIGSFVSLTGISGAVGAFIIAWWQSTPAWTMTPEIAALGIAAMGALAAWFHGRSKQAAALIDRGKIILEDVGIAVTTTPTAPGTTTVTTTTPEA
jgi:hypothetical protein